MSDVKRYRIEQIPADDSMHTGYEWALIDNEQVPTEGDRGGVVLGDFYEYEHAVLVCDALNNYDALRQQLATAENELCTAKDQIPPDMEDDTLSVALIKLKDERHNLRQQLEAAKDELISLHKMVDENMRLKQQLEQAQALLEIERMRLAGCGTAALGYYKRGESIHPDYDSPALQDIVTLYEKLAQSEARVRELEVEIERSERNARDAY